MKNETLFKVTLAEVGAAVVDRYNLTPSSAELITGEWYDVAVAPFNKRAKVVSALRMQLADVCSGGTWARMYNELGGLIDVKVNHILRQR
jgi:hypothetical protein